MANQEPDNVSARKHEYALSERAEGGINAYCCRCGMLARECAPSFCERCGKKVVSCLVRFCSNADRSLSAFLSRNTAFRQTKAFAFAPDICETRQ